MAAPEIAATKRPTGRWRELVRRRRSTARTSLLIWLGNFHLLAIDDRIRRACDDGFLTGEARNNFHFGAEVAAQYDRKELGRVVIFNGSNLQTLRAENQRIHRENERRNVRGNFEVNFGKCAGKQFARSVINIHFDEQRARSEIDGVGGAHQFTLEFPPGKLRQREVGGEAWLSRNGILLRNVDEDAQRASGGDVKEFLRRTGGAGVNQLPNVGVAGGDDAIEGRVDFREGLQIFETLYVERRRVHGCFFGGEITTRIVHILLGNRIGVLQTFIPIVRDLRKAQVCLGSVQVGAGLLQLLVDFRCVNNGEQLTFPHPGADVEIPGLEIAVGAGINRGVYKGLNIARENDLLLGRAAFWMNHVDGRNGQIVRFDTYLRLSPEARDHSGYHDGGHNHERDNQDQHTVNWPRTTRSRAAPLRLPDFFINQLCHCILLACCCAL